MGKEINLLRDYPKTKRNLKKRSINKSPYVRKVARKFGKDFFDGDRKFGYGGYNYNPKYWKNVVKTFVKHWNLKKRYKILDIGCGKGFMLYDLKKTLPGLNLTGIDISRYAIKNAHPKIKKNVFVSNAKKLPFKDKSFDIVISINTIHNLVKSDCAKALREINRVSKIGSFITVDAYRNKIEKKKMYTWNLTAKTIMSVKDWKKFFKKNNYTGDYFWFLP